MKILFLTQRFPNSWQTINGIFNLSRAKALRKLGNNIEVIAPIGLTPPERLLFPYPKFGRIFQHIKQRLAIPCEEEIGGFRVYHPRWFWLPRRWFWKYEVDLIHFFVGKSTKKIISKFCPDAIITSCIHPFGTYSKYIQKYINMPILGIPEGSEVLTYPDLYPGWNSIKRTINKNCDIIISVSNSMRNTLTNKRNLKNVVVINNGYDKELFYYTTKKINNKNDVVIVSVGYFGHVKGHDILLNAMKLLDDNFHLILIGEGGLYEKYLKFIVENNLNNRIKMIGRIDHSQLKYYLDKADIFCMPSRFEGLPAAPLEAMACGIPVVATNAGELPNIIINGFNGYLCENDSPKLLAKSIEKAAREQWDYANIAKWAEENYSWKRWAERITEIVKENIVQ